MRCANIKLQIAIRGRVPAKVCKNILMPVTKLSVHAEAATDVAGVARFCRKSSRRPRRDNVPAVVAAFIM